MLKNHSRPRTAAPALALATNAVGMTAMPVEASANQRMVGVPVVTDDPTASEGFLQAVACDQTTARIVAESVNAAPTDPVADGEPPTTVTNVQQTTSHSTVAMPWTGPNLARPPASLHAARGTIHDRMRPRSRPHRTQRR